MPRQEAHALVADEPFSLAGYRDDTGRYWTVNEGSIIVRVNLMGNQIEVWEPARLDVRCQPSRR